MQNKKFIIILILVVISLSNCTDSSKKSPSNYILKSYTIYKYNDQGQLIYNIDYNITNNRVTNHTISKIEYDKMGQMIKNIQWSPDIGIENVHWLKYDSLGRLISNGGYYHDPENDSWEYKYIFNKHVLNNKGHTIKYHCYHNNKLVSYNQNFYNSDSILSLSIEYDTLNKITRKDSTSWINEYILKCYTTVNGKMILNYEDHFDNKKTKIATTNYDLKGEIENKLTWEQDPKGNYKIFKKFDNSDRLQTISLDIYNNGVLEKTLWIENKLNN